MTITLDFSPAEVQELQTTARLEGMTLAEYARRRLLPSQTRPQTFEEMQEQVAAGFAASGMTEEELEDYVVQSVKHVRQQVREGDGQP